MASNSRCSSASGLMSWKGGNQLTPTSYSDCGLQPVLPSAASSWAGLTSNCQPPTSAVNSWRLPIAETISQWQIDSICGLGMDCIENTTSISSSIVACARCLAVALVLLRVTKLLSSSDCFLVSYSCCQVSCYNIFSLVENALFYRYCLLAFNA
jgi:hypothetical protein